MRKWGFFHLLLMIVFLLTACSNAPKWQVDLELAARDSVKKAFPIELQVSEKGEPATGLHVIAILEMERMDHGTLQFQFEEQGNGKYIAYTAFPMGGKWIATLGLSRGELKMEKAIPFTVPEE